MAMRITTLQAKQIMFCKLSHAVGTDVTVSCYQNDDIMTSWWHHAHTMFLYEIRDVPGRRSDYAARGCCLNMSDTAWRCLDIPRLCRRTLYTSLEVTQWTT